MRRLLQFLLFAVGQWAAAFIAVGQAVNLAYELSDEKTPETPEMVIGTLCIVPATASLWMPSTADLKPEKSLLTTGALIVAGITIGASIKAGRSILHEVG